MDQVQEIIGQVTNTLSDIAQSDVVVGTPLEVGNITLVPISRVAAGFGGGGGEGSGDMSNGKKQSASSGTGGGSGGGAVVRPVAVAVFGDDGVEVLPIAEKPGKLEKLIDSIPDLVDRLKSAKND